MCIHFLAFQHDECPHLSPTPAGGKGFVGPMKCERVLSALDYYHTQPERPPETYPPAIPSLCPAVWGTARCTGNVAVLFRSGKCDACQRVEVLSRLFAGMCHEICALPVQTRLVADGDEGEGGDPAFSIASSETFIAGSEALRGIRVCLEMRGHSFAEEEMEQLLRKIIVDAELPDVEDYQACFLQAFLGKFERILTPEEYAMLSHIMCKTHETGSVSDEAGRRSSDNQTSEEYGELSLPDVPAVRPQNASAFNCEEDPFSSSEPSVMTPSSSCEASALLRRRASTSILELCSTTSAEAEFIPLRLRRTASDGLMTKYMSGSESMEIPSPALPASPGAEGSGLEADNQAAEATGTAGQDLESGGEAGLKPAQSARSLPSLSSPSLSSSCEQSPATCPSAGDNGSPTPPSSSAPSATAFLESPAPMRACPCLNEHHIGTRSPGSNAAAGAAFMAGPTAPDHRRAMETGLDAVNAFVGRLRRGDARMDLCGASVGAYNDLNAMQLQGQWAVE